MRPTGVVDPLISVRLVSFMKGGEGKRLMRPGRKLGEMEEYFFEMLTPGDTFLFTERPITALEPTTGSGPTGNGRRGAGGGASEPSVTVGSLRGAR